jgi:parvulin-like peptidyl-prolyl isomerase
MNHEFIKKPTFSCGWQSCVSTLAITIALSLSGCKPAAENARNGIAEVNGQPISEESFRHWWNQEPRAIDNFKNRKVVLEEMIERSVIAQKARALGLENDPQVVAEIESLLIARLKEKELQPQIEKIEVTEAEARAVYELNKSSQYALPERMRVAVLWFETRGQQPLVARYQPRLEKVRAHMATATDAVSGEKAFGQFAIEHSEHPSSRYKGGDIGWLEAGKQPDAWRNAVAEIAADLETPGEISPVITRPEGVFLVRLMEHRAADHQPFEQARAEIVRQLRNQKRHAIEQAFMSELTRNVQVREFPDRLAAITGLPIYSNTVAATPNQLTLRAKP